MKKCTYCGREYPDDATNCAIDGQPLVPAPVPPVGTAAPPVAQTYQSRKLLSYVAPVRAGVVLAILYGFFGLIFIPFFIIVAIIGQKSGGGNNPAAALGGVFAAIFFPVIYAVAGFIGGVIAAALYNLVAKWTGGFELEIRDVAVRPY